MSLKVQALFFWEPLRKNVVIGFWSETFGNNCDWVRGKEMECYNEFFLRPWLRHCWRILSLFSPFLSSFNFFMTNVAHSLAAARNIFILPTRKYFSTSSSPSRQLFIVSFEKDTVDYRSNGKDSTFMNYKFVSFFLIHESRKSLESIFVY